MNGGAPVIHSYKPEQVAAWASPPTETTRFVIQIDPNDGGGLLPLLQAGLAEGGRLELAASRGGADRVPLPLDDSARAALADLLSVFLKAQPLVVEGVIKRELLDGQVFAKGANIAVPPAASESMSSLTTEETVELERMSTGRGSGRFGDITWTPPGELARSVRGLGWMRDRVVLREGDGPVKLVPFSEIGEEHRKKLLTERLSDFSGNRPPATPQGILYFPEDWTDHQKKSGQGLVFGRDESSGEAFLLARGLANKFKGGASPILRSVAKRSRDLSPYPSRQATTGWKPLRNQSGPTRASGWILRSLRNWRNWPRSSPSTSASLAGRTPSPFR